MLDKTKDFGTVSGNSSVKYYQNGKYYTLQGQEVTEYGVPVKGVGKPVVPSIIDTPVEPTVDKQDEVSDEPIDDREEMVIEAQIDQDLEGMNWREIKTRVVAAGGVWTNKIEGINYLRGL